jgi:hypothetical protein
VYWAVPRAVALTISGGVLRVEGRPGFAANLLPWSVREVSATTGAPQSVGVALQVHDGRELLTVSCIDVSKPAGGSLVPGGWNGYWCNAEGYAALRAEVGRHVVSGYPAAA